jgi:hypothetical protein
MALVDGSMRCGWRLRTRSCCINARSARPPVPLRGTTSAEERTRWSCSTYEVQSTDDEPLVLSADILTENDLICQPLRVINRCNVFSACRNVVSQDSYDFQGWKDCSFISLTRRCEDP